MNQKQKLRYGYGYLLLLSLNLLLILWNVYTGSVSAEGQLLMEIMIRIRLPRSIAACLLGGVLSVSGFLLQIFFANPIAGPFVLGISSSAKLAVALAMVFALERGWVLNNASMILVAFGGALLSLSLILLISRKIKRMSMLIVCGVMTGYLCSAVTDFVVAFADDSNIVNLHNWSLGSFAGIGWTSVRAMGIVTAAAVLPTLLLTKPMGAYQLGESHARNAGVNLRRFRLELILVSSVLSACVTAFAGPVSFVGVAVPHLMKRLFGTEIPLVILPACFLGGGAFCLLCDLIARTAFAPMELSVSSVTAVFGAPVVIGMMAAAKRR